MKYVHQRSTRSSFGGLAVKLLYFVLGLLGAFLFYSGNLLWIANRRKAAQDKQAFGLKLLEKLTPGVCLGSVAGISAMFSAGLLLPEIWHGRVYFLVFFLSLLWACIRPAQRVNIELLYGIAVLSLLIPIAAYWHFGQNILTSWWQGDWLRAGIESMILVMSMIWFVLARKLQSRS